MKVDKSKTKVISGNHSIEVGISSWDESETSIRCRYDSAESGRFSPHASSELPLGDILPIMEVAAENDLITVSECAAIIEALSQSILRQST